MHIYLNESETTLLYTALIWDRDVVITSFHADTAPELGALLQASEYANLPVTYTWGPEQPEYPAKGVTLAEMVEAIFL